MSRVENGFVFERIGSRDHHESKVRQFFKELGPGIVTGAADDDPSGISTYSIAGATFGLSFLWTVLLTFPLMTAVQSMCARLALVSGEGLAAVIRRRYPRWLLVSSCVLLFVANVVNIAADLSGMAESMAMIVPIPKNVATALFAIAIVSAMIFWNYRRLAQIFKWLTLVLAAYVLAAILARPNWPDVLWAAITPRIVLDRQNLLTLVALLGTTITPYMFFWQASQEVEEERAQGKRTLRERAGASPAELRVVDRDVLVGMSWAGIAMFFIILTTATTLHGSGVEIKSAKDAAEALRPIAGDLSYLLFTLGIVGTGILAVPVLAGSAAYAIAEAMHWPGSLNSKPRVGRKFYAVIVIAVVAGLALDYLRIDAVQALFYAAVVNGVLAPPLVAIVALLNGDRKTMGDSLSPLWMRIVGWLAVAIMGACAIAIPFCG